MNETGTEAKFFVFRCAFDRSRSSQQLRRQLVLKCDSGGPRAAVVRPGHRRKRAVRSRDRPCDHVTKRCRDNGGRKPAD